MSTEKSQFFGKRTKSKWIIPFPETTTNLKSLVEQRVQSKSQQPPEKKRRIDPQDSKDTGLLFLTPVNEKRWILPKENVFFVENNYVPEHGWPFFVDMPPLFHINFTEIKDGTSTISELNTACMGMIVATCDGLIVLKNRLERGLIILNPLTKELENIPLGTIYSTPQPSGGGFFSRKFPVENTPHATISLNPPHESYGLGFCKSTGRYKLVHLFKDSLNYVGCEIMDVGSGAPWRAVNGPPKEYFYSLRRPVFAMGALHWLPTENRNSHMVTMALDDENFRKIRLPGAGRVANGIFEMDGGFVGCVTIQEGVINGVDVWVLKGLGGEGWEKVYSIDDVEGVRNMEPLYSGRISGELVFKDGFKGEVYAYERRLRVMRKIEMVEEWRSGFSGDCGCWFPHVNSLVSWRSKANEDFVS